MKKKIYIFTILIIFALFNSGCNDGFLDTTPYDGFSSSMIYSSDANATYAINGAYNALANRSFEVSFYNYVTNLGPESYEHGRAAYGLSHSKGLATTRDSEILNNYKNFYRPIVYANDIIAGLNGNENVSAELRERLIGEAKFIRGICYFYLWNLFGKVVILDKPTPISETYLPRSSEEKVKELIISDFQDAINRLPVSYSSPADIGRITKGAAIAMLGKTYMYDKQWANAVAQFEKLLGSPFSYNLVSDYAYNFSIDHKNSVESVFELQYVNLENLGSSFDRWYGNRSTAVAGGDRANMSSQSLYVFTNRDGSSIDLSTMPKRSGYANDLEHGKALIPWYQKTFANADLRLHKSVILPGSTYIGAGGITRMLYWPQTNYVSANPPAIATTYAADAKILIRKFLTEGDVHVLYREDGQMNYPLIRFADVLLMYAEAKNEVDGAVSEVYKAVNRVRSRAGIVDLPAGLSKEDMRRNIWLERYRELMFEGHLYFDVKRWHVAHTNDPIFGLNNNIYDFRLEKIFFKKLFVENKDYLWPIPGSEIDINPLLDQNPNW